MDDSRRIRPTDEMTRAFGPTFGRKPLYAVLFSTIEDLDSLESPLMTDQTGQDTTGTVPHGFDREVAAALPGLWYCLHLPNDFLQLIDIPLATVKASQELHLDHRILVAPIQLFDQDHVGGWLSSSAPVLIVCPDDLMEEAGRRSSALRFPLPAVAFSDLSDDSLRAHWEAIHANFVPEAPYFGHEPKLARRLDLAPTDLPMRWLARQMGNPRDAVNDASDLDGLVGEALRHQLVLAALSRLEGEGPTPGVAEQELPHILEEERNRLRVPVALALPGVASRYSRSAYRRWPRDRLLPLTGVDEADTWSAAMHERSDTLVERAAIEFVTTHQAIERGGLGLMLPSLPQLAFTLLAELERHCEQTAQGPTVWRMLERLDAAAQPLWSEALLSAVAHASMLVVFTNFPIGLLRMPGDTAALLSRVPIAYRPLLPLTRTVQMELTPVSTVDLTTQFRVLVAECLPPEDPVGRISRIGWESAGDVVRRSGQSLTFEFAETLSLQALRATLAERRPDFLVISAHGFYDAGRNAAGLVIGHEPILGPELGPLPPVVILSACHVAPRGASAVTITDLLLREGAVAVLGTQVPVNVAHNAMLMVRFFVYITEVLAQREEHSTLLEVWHRVQTSNAINDILNGSDALRSWGRSTTPSGQTVLEEFMRVRSTGQLHVGSIYEDTERVLGEIADDQGNGDRVRNWFRSPGYVPESLFYVFAGRPERVYLRPRVPGRSR